MNNLSIELRLNNTIFKCNLEDKYYNTKEKTAYAVSVLNGVTPNQQGNFSLLVDVFTICADCYKNSDLKFEDPSPIKVPNAKEAQDIIRKAK